jgi:hypothetical protein
VADDPKENPLGELRDLFRQVTRPVLDSFDHRLSDQVDKRVDERLTQTLETALADRLAVIERAVADLDRAVKALAAKLDED